MTIQQYSRLEMQMKTECIILDSKEENFLLCVSLNLCIDVYQFICQTVHKTRGFTVLVVNISAEDNNFIR